MNPLAFGQMDCHEFVVSPAIASKDYINGMVEICTNREIDLLIPGTDDDLLCLAIERDRFENIGTRLLAADVDLITTCRNKESLPKNLPGFDHLFATTWTKSSWEHSDLYFPLISKPKDGSGSIGIKIIRSHEEIEQLDPSDILQELLVPSSGDEHHPHFMEQVAKGVNIQVAEISVQYVTGPSGQLLGKMASRNRLKSGVPIEIEVLDTPELWQTLDPLYQHLRKRGLSGPINMQGRFTDKGFKLFEMNPRFTGITGLRAMLGFNEVESCVAHWLKISGACRNLLVNQRKIGVRQVTDKAVDQSKFKDRTTLKVESNEVKKVILLTGSTGYLGRSLAPLLKEEQWIELWTLDRDREKAASYIGSNGNCYNIEDYQQGTLQLGRVDILIHAAFSRPHYATDQIAASLAFTSDLFNSAAKHQIPAILNISSQSVYGNNISPPWIEETPVDPKTAYGQAKYGAELLCGSVHSQYPHLKCCSLRVATLAGGTAGLVEVEVISRLVKQVMRGEKIIIEGGHQTIARLHLKDAAEAIVKMLRNPLDSWRPVYCLGPDSRYKLLDVANEIVRIGIIRGYNTVLELRPTNEKDSLIREEWMESELFYQEIDWRPRKSLRDLIISYYCYYEDNIQN